MKSTLGAWSLAFVAEDWGVGFRVQGLRIWGLGLRV